MNMNRHASVESSYSSRSSDTVRPPGVKRRTSRGGTPVSIRTTTPNALYVSPSPAVAPARARANRVRKKAASAFCGRRTTMLRENKW